MSNPVLIEIMRGGLVESRHAGAIAVAYADGGLRLGIGDITRPVFPLSAIKPLQAIPLVETGTADALGFGREELALVCASHSGTQRHTNIALRMLASAALDIDALGCGVHPPSDEASALGLITSGRAPSSLHNNCSGKHAGMLATAMHMDEPVAGYWTPDHPVQQRIECVLEDLTGLRLDTRLRGVDGCSVPNWAMPLTALARAYARFVTGEGLAAGRAADCRRIFQACVAEPELIAGPGRSCTQFMMALGGRGLVKIGAEGVYIGAIPELGAGIALKIDDGAARAAHAAMATVLAFLMPDCRRVLVPHMMQALTNWRGTRVGEVRPSSDLLRALGPVVQTQAARVAAE